VVGEKVFSLLNVMVILDLRLLIFFLMPLTDGCVASFLFVCLFVKKEEEEEEKEEEKIEKEKEKVNNLKPTIQFEEFEERQFKQLLASIPTDDSAALSSVVDTLKKAKEEKKLPNTFGSLKELVSPSCQVDLAIQPEEIIGKMVVSEMMIYEDPDEILFNSEHTNEEVRSLSIRFNERKLRMEPNVNWVSVALVLLMLAVSLPFLMQIFL